MKYVRATLELLLAAAFMAGIAAVVLWLRGRNHG